MPTISPYPFREPYRRRANTIAIVRIGDGVIYTARHAPASTLEGHLTFALKYEGLDLAVLKRLFVAAGEEAIESMVKATPTGTYARRIGFLYEWLLTKRLMLPDTRKGAYALAVGIEQQWAAQGETSPRHRVWNRAFQREHGKKSLPGSRILRCSSSKKLIGTCLA